MMSHNIEPLVDCTTSGFILDENNKYFKKVSIYVLLLWKWIDLESDAIEISL